MSTLVNITLKPVIINKGIPCDLTLKSKPSESMIKALQEAYAIAEAPEEYTSYDNSDQLFEDILKNDWAKNTKNKNNKGV